MIRWLFQSKHLEPYLDDLLDARATGDFFKLFELFRRRFSPIEIRLCFSFESRGKPSYYGETPLGFACCTNQWEIVEILLENDADMDAVRFFPSFFYRISSFSSSFRSIRTATTFYTF